MVNRKKHIDNYWPREGVEQNVGMDEAIFLFFSTLTDGRTDRRTNTRIY